MELAETKLLDSLERDLLKRQRAVNSQLKIVQKQESKLDKILQREKTRKLKKSEHKITPSVIRYQEELEKQRNIKTFLEEKLTTIGIKVREIKKTRKTV